MCRDYVCFLLLLLYTRLFYIKKPFGFFFSVLILATVLLPSSLSNTQRFFPPISSCTPLVAGDVFTSSHPHWSTPGNITILALRFQQVAKAVGISSQKKTRGE